MVKDIEKKNNRMQILSQIDNLTQSNCVGCKLEQVDYCKNKCAIGIQLFQLGEKLNSSTKKADTVEKILAKGKDMKKADIEKLLSLEVNRMKIKKALKMTGYEFSILLKNLGIERGSEGNEGMTKIKMTVDEYVKWRFVDKLSYEDIASKFSASESALHAWIKKRASEIDVEKANLGIPVTVKPKEVKDVPVNSNYDNLIKELSLKVENKAAELEEKDKTLKELEMKIESLEKELKKRNIPKLDASPSNELKEIESKLAECYKVIENTEQKLLIANESIRKYTNENAAMRGLLRLWV